jgi:serine/threonine protein kinase
MSEGEPSPEPKPAPRLGSYLLVQPLGSGGMSNVFRAVHEETGSIVAVKVLPRALAKNVTLLQRFIREAKSAEALDHPNIVAIYDRGFDQDRHYLVLEYVEGRDLHDRVRINGTMAPDDSVRFIREVAQGLSYASGRGMIHRDVKPANLLLTPDGHAKIIDLGLALQTEDEDERVTRDGTTVGTVDYMAPEQARDSRQTSERSDIYSLGCTFYYLLTGSAPFPGGNLTDKLARHYKAPIPDVRAHRIDVSEELSLLIRKMMEKKPELRFHDYDQLIAALDNLGKPAPARAEVPVLDALIVDDDDDDEIGLAPTESAIIKGKPEADRLSSTHDQFLMAEIVDDDDDDEPAPPPQPVPKRLPSSSPSKSRPREAPPKKPSAPVPEEISLADLAALDADDEIANRRSGQRKSPSSQTVKTTNSASSPRIAAPPLSAILDDDEDDEETVIGSGGPPRRNFGEEVPLKTWIAAGVLIGLSLGIVAFGVSMVISMTKPTRPEIAERPVEEIRNEPPPEVDVPVRRPNQPAKPTPPVVKKPPINASPAIDTPSPGVIAAVEPPPVEKKYPPEWEARLFPTSLTQVAPFPDKSKVLVHRVIEAGDEPQTSSIASALTRAVDVVEVADTGPFFEDDCQISGKTKWIKARAGIRPMIRIDVTSSDIIKQQTAKIIVGGSKIERLILQGIDITVDVRGLPDHQTALFLCQGAELILRDCSLTVINANDASRVRRFSIFRVEEGPRPNRIILDRSTIRGPVRTLFDVASSRASIVFDRSLVVGDAGPLIVLENTEKSGRSLAFYRSLIATRGPVLEIPGKSPPTIIRSLGSTFARIDGMTSSPMIVTRANFTGEPFTALDWSGEDNAFVGWSGWLTSNLEATPRVADIERIRSIWPGSDASSLDSPNPWPVVILRDDVLPDDLTRLAPNRRGTLVKIASPQPLLKDLTIGSVQKLVVPELSASLIPPLSSFHLMTSGTSTTHPPTPPDVPLPTPKSSIRPPPEQNATGPRPKLKTATSNPQGPVAPKAPPKPPEPLNLTFNVVDLPWSGDLGAFLAEKIVKGTFRVTVEIRGSGNHAMSPIRLPNGLSIGILGDSNEGSKPPMSTFYPKPGVAGKSMIEIHGGDLAIANIGFTTDGSNRPLHWIYAQDSILAIKHCRFREPGGTSPTVGPLIAFVARSARPIPARVGPLVSATDRPTARLKDCLIWTGGEALSAELGRGVVEFDNCLIISGGPAIMLLPQKVDRHSFEADLVLDRCTIAVDKTSVHLGPWPGEPLGPSRPWLISTRRCAFPRTQTAQTGALLQVDPDSMSRGTLFWQSFGDVYDLSRFLAPIGTQPSNIPNADLKKQWIDLWGQQHARNDQGPNPRGPNLLLRFKEKLKPGKLTPGALELEAGAQKDLGVDFKDLPPAPRG